MSFPIYLQDVVTLVLDEEKCTGCGMCLEVCPHAVLARENGHVRIESRDSCMECGACAKNCSVEAITVQTGVGCAMAVINSALGRNAASCCCVIETSDQKVGKASEAPCSGTTSCC
jgi:ferredoxin